MQRKIIVKKLIAAIVVALPLAANAAPPSPVAPASIMDMKSALLKTLSGPVNGPSVIGVIPTGSPQLTMISQMTGSKEPAQITITKVKDYTRVGCGRLELVFHQDKMKLKAGGTGNNFFMTQYLDICADGSLPEVPVIQPQTSGSPVIATKPTKTGN